MNELDAVNLTPFQGQVGECKVASCANRNRGGGHHCLAVDGYGPGCVDGAIASVVPDGIEPRDRGGGTRS